MTSRYDQTTPLPSVATGVQPPLPKAVPNIRALDHVALIVETADQARDLTNSRADGGRTTTMYAQQALARFLSRGGQPYLNALDAEITRRRAEVPGFAQWHNEIIQEQRRNSSWRNSTLLPLGRSLVQFAAAYGLVYAATAAASASASTVPAATPGAASVPTVAPAASAAVPAAAPAAAVPGMTFTGAIEAASGAVSTAAGVAGAVQQLTGGNKPPSPTPQRTTTQAQPPAPVDTSGSGLLTIAALSAIPLVPPF